MPIEQTLRPETVNELLLIERIHELQRLHYMNSGPSYPGLRDPNDGTMELGYLGPTLHLAGRFTAEKSGVDAIPGTLKLSARTHGPTSFGYGQYVSAQQLHQMRPGDEARMFDHIWREGMHSLAKELKRIQEKA